MRMLFDAGSSAPSAAQSSQDVVRGTAPVATFKEVTGFSKPPPKPGYAEISPLDNLRSFLGGSGDVPQPPGTGAALSNLPPPVPISFGKDKPGQFSMVLDKVRCVPGMRAWRGLSCRLGLWGEGCT